MAEDMDLSFKDTTDMEMESPHKMLESFLTESLHVLSDSKVFVHLLLAWIVSIVFCFTIFPMFHSRITSTASSNIKDKADDDKAIDTGDEAIDHDRDRGMMSPPSSSGAMRHKTPRAKTASPPVPADKTMDNQISFRFTPTQTPDLRHHGSLMGPEKSPDSRFLNQLVRDMCSKAKDAGRHPSYASLVLTNVLNYNLDINKSVLSNNLTIFHCACLSCNLELVTSLAPMADLTKATSQGETPLYLAVYAASYRAKTNHRSSQEGMEIVKYLLDKGCDVNKANDAGKTALHQAMRLGHGALVRTLLDWGAEMMSGHDSSFMRTSPSSNTTTNLLDVSIISHCSSVVTRAMSKRRTMVQQASTVVTRAMSRKRDNVESLDKSFAKKAK